jgi:hypothetical protein
MHAGDRRHTRQPPGQQRREISPLRRTDRPDLRIEYRLPALE